MNKVIKLKELVEIEEALGELLSVKLPAPVSYLLSKTSSQLIAELQLFSKARNQLLEELGTPVKDQPGAYSITEENVLEYSVGLNEILDTEITLTTFEGIDITKLDKVEISTKSLLQMLEFGLVVDASIPPPKSTTKALEFDDGIPF